MRLSICFLLAFVTMGARAADSVSLAADADDPGVLVDAFYSDAPYNDSCANDRKFAGPPTSLPISNAKPDGECRQEVVVFTTNKRVHVVEAPGFTTADTDTVDTALTAIVDLPVDFWYIGTPGLTPEQKSAIDQELNDHLDDASLAFESSRAGIGFTKNSLTYIDDLSWAQELAGIADEVFLGVASPEAFRELIGKHIGLDGATGPPHQADPAHLNVFVLEFASEARGFHISSEEGVPKGEIMMRYVPELGTLAHEIGHALSLDHVNFVGLDVVHRDIGEYCIAFGSFTYYKGVCDYEAGNVMWAGQVDALRNTLTEGQGFRASLNSLSFVNLHNYRPGDVVRNCADWQYDEQCPYLALQIETADQDIDQ